MKKIIFTILIAFISITIANGQEKENKEKDKSKFGLYFDNLSPTQKGFNAETNGVVINKISKDRPGKAAGVMVGDILTHIGTIAIKDQEHCILVMKDYDTSKGTSTLKIIRNGIKMGLKVIFME